MDARSTATERGLTVAEQRLEEAMIRLEERMSALQAIVSRMDSHVTGNLVTKEQFEPVKRLVYGAAGLILIGVVGALMALVVTK